MRLLGSVRGNEPCDEVCKRLHERQEESRRDEVEERVNGRHRSRDVRIRRHAVRHDRVEIIGEERDRQRQNERHEERDDEESAGDIEERMRESRLSRLGGTVERGQPRRGGRADVHAEDGGRRRLEAQQALLGERHGDGRRRGGRLDHRREDQGEENALREAPGRGRIERLERLDYRRHRTDGFHARIHPVEAHEDEAESHQGKADVLKFLAVLEEMKRGSGQNDRKPENLHVRGERNHPGRGGRADVRADDEIDRLRQVHEAGRDESDGHDGNDRRRLDDHRRDKSCSDARDPVRGRERHEFP